MIALVGAQAVVPVVVAGGAVVVVGLVTRWRATAAGVDGRRSAAAVLIGFDFRFAL